MSNKAWRIVALLFIVVPIIICIIISFIITYFPTSDVSLILASDFLPIQPINNKIKVSGNADTDVIFTDIESRKQYTIGYITHGMSETIQLEKGKWYSVEGAGELTIRPVNVRIE